jgi:hypothetical protein
MEVNGQFHVKSREYEELLLQEMEREGWCILVEIRNNKSKKTNKVSS